MGQVTAPVNDRNGKKMNHADGNLAKLFYALLAVAVVLAVGTVMTPYVAQYEVKQAAKLTCTSFMRGARDIKANDWRDEFVRKARMSGVQLKSDQQYLFAIEKQPNLNRWHCTFKVAWNSETPVFLIGQYLPNIPPLKITHRIDDAHDVAITF
jgi:hypothetical protein